MSNTVLIGFMLLTLDLTFLSATAYGVTKKSEGFAFFTGMLTIVALYFTFAFMGCLNI